MFTLNLGIAIQRQQRQFERQIALRMRIQKVLALANQFPRDRSLQRMLNHKIDTEIQQKLSKDNCETSLLFTYSLVAQNSIHETMQCLYDIEQILFERNSKQTGANG